MFIDYKIDNDILYLEIDVNYEFGEYKSKNSSIIDQIKEFISIHNIKKDFNKIIITCSGIIIGSIIFFNNDNIIDNDNIKYIPSFKSEVKFNNKEEKIEDIIDIDKTNINKIEKVEEKTQKTEENTNKSSNITQNNITQNSNDISNNIETNPSVSNDITITVYRSSGQVIDISLEEYVIGVIAAEMPASFNVETIKAQSVVARTYALKAKKTGKTLTDTVSTQSYIDIDAMKNKWGNDFNFYYNKIKDASYSTKDEYLSYNNEYIEALYHSTNNGKTESSLDVFGNYYPYLISVSSEFDKSASSYLRTTTMNLNDVSSKLGIPMSNDAVIQIISYTDGGNIKEIMINDKSFTGKHFRELLGLRSADFDINISNNTVTITTRGFGHGVGMSQYGANGMANAGYSYKDILYHYYPGTTLKK